MAPKLNWEGGGRQLLRKTAPDSTGIIGGPTTPCPTPMSDPETGPFSGTQICSAGKRSSPAPPGPKSLETQMPPSPRIPLWSRAPTCGVQCPVPTPQCPQSMITPDARSPTLPGPPHAQRDPPSPLPQGGEIQLRPALAAERSPGSSGRREAPGRAAAAGGGRAQGGGRLRTAVFPCAQQGIANG